MPGRSHSEESAWDAYAAPFERLQQQLQSLERLLTQELSEHQSGSPLIPLSFHALSNTVQEAKRNHLQAIDPEHGVLQSEPDVLVRAADLMDELEQTKAELLKVSEVVEAYQEERRRLIRLFFEHANEGVVLLDAQGMIQDVNRVFREIACREDPCLIGRPLQSTLEWTFSDYQTVLDDALTGKAWTGQVVIARGKTEERTYLISFSPVQLGEQFTHVIVQLFDVTELERTQQSLKRQALHDQLTGLPNRWFFRERIQSLIDESYQQCRSFAVCFIDLDDFKQINDSLGHFAGDDLLMQVAQRICKAVGEDAFVARFGGDEFAVLIPERGSDRQTIHRMTDRLQKSFVEPFDIAGISVRVGASIGVVNYPTQSRDINELLQFADIAMYAAKAAGRNQTCWFASEMRHQVKRSQRIQRELIQALDNCDITVEYQPQIDMHSDLCVGCEALARWRTPDGQQVTPREFVSVAQRTGLVIPLDEAVLRAVCKQLVQWEEEGVRPQRVAVNVSSQQLYEETFVDRMSALLDETGTRPEWITMEFVENTVMKDTRHATQVMDALSGLGFRIALDNFGTGHSSLGFLKQFHVDSLKIDRSFIREMTDHEHARSIVESVILLGQGHGIEVIAEGVETAKQLEAVREMGCHVAQGYYLSRPLEAEDFERFFKQTNGSATVSG